MRQQQKEGRQVYLVVKQEVNRKKGEYKEVVSPQQFATIMKQSRLVIHLHEPLLTRYCGQVLVEEHFWQSSFERLG